MRLFLHRRSVLLACLFGVLVGVLPRCAFAHAVLQKSVPAAHAAISMAGLGKDSLPILLTYNSRIDAAHSSLALVGADGKTSQLTIDTTAEPNVLRSEARGIRAGHYSLHWQVVASDGHITRGSIDFDVR